jgi:hypothetical protein
MCARAAAPHTSQPCRPTVFSARIKGPRAPSGSGNPRHAGKPRWSKGGAAGPVRFLSWGREPVVGVLGAVPRSASGAASRLSPPG